MSALPVSSIRALADLHPKPSNLKFQYGTAGFRTLYVTGSTYIRLSFKVRTEVALLSLSCSESAFSPVCEVRS